MPSSNAPCLTCPQYIDNLPLSAIPVFDLTTDQGQALHSQWLVGLCSGCDSY